MVNQFRLLKESPVQFVKKILKAEPDPWQAEALKAVATSPRVAIRSGHGVGKTVFESWAILWHLFTNSCSKAVCTAPTARQLYDILFSELSRWLRQSPLMSDLFEWTKTKLYKKTSPEMWFAVARTSNRPENLQGFHDKNLLFVIDEASGVEDSIFEAIEGALTTAGAKLLICGNPTKNSGFFKRAFHEERELYRTFKVSSTDSVRVSGDYCERLIKTYGADSDVVRVRVYGEFPKGESDGLISLESVEAAMMREPDYDGDLVMGVDVARFGDDETVTAARLGDDCLPLKAWRHADLMTTCGRIVHELERLMTSYKKSRAVINVDDSGLGGGVTDRLREVLSSKVTVNACLNNAKPRDKHYANYATECWYGLKERLTAGDITLPRDDTLTAQLTTRRYSLTSSDKLILESKADYKKRFKKSPDRADALVLAYAPTAQVSAPKYNLIESYWRG